MKAEIQHFSPDGFTLLEAVIALLIFSISLLSLYAMQTASISGNKRSIELTYASTWAVNTIEDLSNLDYDDLIDEDGDGTDQDSDGDGDGEDDDGGNFGLEDVEEATADGFAESPDKKFKIYWNVAVDYPTKNLKTLRIAVFYTVSRSQKQVIMDYVIPNS